MSKIKYTADGKKVVIIGDLNQTDKIVQEIYVTENGDEIPQGERFVVKTLLDSPAKSWKESELEKLEERYNKEKADWEHNIKRIKEEKSRAYDALSARVKWLRGVAKEPRDEKFKEVINLLAEFLSPTEKWVLVKNYASWDLVKFNEDGINELFERHEGIYEYTRFDSMRLLSLYGESNGDLTFRINEYSDGSGNGDKKVYFFKSKESAIIFIQSEFSKLEKYYDWNVETAKKYNLDIDAEKLEAYKEEKRQGVLKAIEESTKRLNVLNGELQSI